MNLIIFDIDGTLTQTNEIDSKCFARAVEDTLQIKRLNTDWADYQYSTDSGFLHEIYLSFLKRLPFNDEINVIKNLFVDYLKEEWIRDNACYAPIPGAETIFQKITDLSNWHVALATGGWETSALFKLNAASIPFGGLAKAYADDHIERTEIIKMAKQRSEALHGVSEYQRLIYVGDRLWDERAANDLNIEFIGVGTEFQNRADASGVFIESYEKTAILLNYLSFSKDTFY